MVSYFRKLSQENLPFVILAIRHKESNWAKFLMQDLKNAVCAPEHLFHRVGTFISKGNNTVGS